MDDCHESPLSILYSKELDPPPDAFTVILPVGRVHDGCIEFTFTTGGVQGLPDIVKLLADISKNTTHGFCAHSTSILADVVAVPAGI